MFGECRHTWAVRTATTCNRARINTCMRAAALTLAPPIHRVRTPTTGLRFYCSYYSLFTTAAQKHQPRAVARDARIR